MQGAVTFRRIALGLEDSIESEHMGHPDFRVTGKIFAGLQADNEWGTVKLTPDQQEHFIAVAPSSFRPASGGWGRQGWTSVRLDSVDEELLGAALTQAWQNVRRAATKARPAKQARPRPAAR
jgi:predicted DNA-binding protein (MmcQ/YjbR family)